MMKITRFKNSEYSTASMRDGVFPAYSSYISESIHTKLDIKFRNLLEANNIVFSGSYKNCCIGIVDLVNSTKITARLTREQATRYYSIFLNSMSMIIGEYGGSVVKNGGDSLLYHFPGTCNTSNIDAFENAIECGLSMIDFRELINEILNKAGLPNASYRISCDYGQVATAKTQYSECEDIFGATVNLCAKINHQATPNTMVIGGDVYQIVKNMGIYKFQPSPDRVSGLKIRYPVYYTYRSLNHPNYNKNTVDYIVNRMVQQRNNEKGRISFFQANNSGRTMKDHSGTQSRLPI